MRDTPPRPPAAIASGCLVRLVFLGVELTLGVLIVALVVEQVSPGLAARGYDMKTGSGVLIAVTLGAAAAIYPVLFLDRFARRVAARM